MMKKKNKLSDFIKNGIKLNLIQEDFTIETYYDCIITDRLEEEEELSNTQNKNFFTKFNEIDFGSQYDNYFTDNVNKKLEPFGLKIAPYLSVGLRSPLKCLIEHNFAKNKIEIINKLLETIIEQRYTSFFIDKNDNQTIDEYYNLILVANIINLDYENFILAIKNFGDLPIDFSWNFPVDFFFKILSRIYNVVIQFLSENFNHTVFDNTIGSSPYCIYIYQYSMDYYFNLISVDEIFKPVIENTNINEQKINHFESEQEEIIDI